MPEGVDLECLLAAHHHVYFGRHKDGALESEFSGNLVEVCPTGVFTDKTFKAALYAEMGSADRAFDLRTLQSRLQYHSRENATDNSGGFSTGITARLTAISSATGAASVTVSSTAPTGYECLSSEKMIGILILSGRLANRVTETAPHRKYSVHVKVEPVEHPLE